jgi:hypothetical protein
MYVCVCVSVHKRMHAYIDPWNAYIVHNIHTYTHTHIYTYTNFNVILVVGKCSSIHAKEEPVFGVDVRMYLCM